MRGSQEFQFSPDNQPRYSSSALGPCKTFLLCTLYLLFLPSAGNPVVLMINRDQRNSVTHSKSHSFFLVQQRLWKSSWRKLWRDYSTSISSHALLLFLLETGMWFRLALITRWPKLDLNSWLSGISFWSAEITGMHIPSSLLLLWLLLFFFW